MVAFLLVFTERRRFIVKKENNNLLEGDGFTNEVRLI